MWHHTGTLQVNLIQMAIWIGYTTSLFLILFIENDKIHQSLAIKQIKWIWGLILKIRIELLGGATASKFEKQMNKLQYIHY